MCGKVGPSDRFVDLLFSLFPVMVSHVVQMSLSWVSHLFSSAILQSIVRVQKRLYKSLDSRHVSIVDIGSIKSYLSSELNEVLLASYNYGTERQSKQWLCSSSSVCFNLYCFENSQLVQ